MASNGSAPARQLPEGGQFRFFGKYRLLATLGRGGMGDIYLALAHGPVGLTKLVVIKCLRAEFAGDPVYRMMFLDEARLAARLTHPHVVHVYEVGEQNDEYFLAMEYLDGQSLYGVVHKLEERQQQLPVTMSARVLYDALDGIHYAHELRDYDETPLHIVHRDIKPDNIFITYDGQIKIVIAKAAFNLAHTSAGSVKGTFGYMAPEQANEGAIDRRTDVFSMGIVLWELLAGRRLMPRESPRNLVKLLHEPVPHLSEINPDIDCHLAGIVAKALKRNPDERFQTAQEMRDALGALFTIEKLARHDDLSRFLTRIFYAERERSHRYIKACLQTAADDSSSTPPPPVVEPSKTAFPSSGSFSLSQAITHAIQETPPTLPKHSLARDTTPGVRGTARGWRAWWFPLSVSVLALGSLASGFLLLEHFHLHHSDDPRDGREPTNARTVSSAPVLSDVYPHTLLRLHGSHTMGAEIIPSLAEAFFKYKGAELVARHPGATWHASNIVGGLPGMLPEQNIEITAEGSSTAFADLEAQRCDIGMSSRRIKPEEEEALKQKGFGDMTSATTEHVVAIDGIAVIVHPNNPLSVLSVTELTKVFSGEFTDWSQLGQRHAPIHVYAWGDKSGTYDTFKSIVLGAHELVPNAKRFPTGGMLNAEVAGDINSIGFTGFRYAGNAKTLAIYEHDSKPMVPTAFTVATEDYLLTRRLYLYTPARTTNPWTQDFINFALSNNGQNIVRSVGFVDLTVKMEDDTLCEKNCTPYYLIITRKSHRLSVNFRFRPGEIALDNRALRDIDRLIAFLQTLHHPKVILLGFSDRMGDYPHPLELSRERACKVDGELRERGVYASPVEGFGAEMPITSGDDEMSRERNRRVEVWVQSTDTK